MKPSLKFVIPFIAMGLFVLPNMANAQKREGAVRNTPPREGVHKEAPKRTNNVGSNNNHNNTEVRGNNTEVRGNKVDNSKHNNVNINVDNSKTVKVNNSHNTTVRVNNNVHYGNPHYYGGHNYYCSRPYYYHPYRPYRWGPVWHPWGFFIATMATTAIIVSIENQPQPYYYDQGVYYMPGNGGYTVVQAPVGAAITVLPSGYETVQVSPTVNNYYYGGAYYQKTPTGYVVVQPTAGTFVTNLPDGGTEVTMGSVKYVQYGSTYYQPVQVNGQSMYEVVLMK